MAYQDTWAACTKCEKQFVFRVEEQRRQAKRGEEITPPELCPTCRAPARAEQSPRPQSMPRSRPEAEQKPRTPAALGPGPHEGNVKWYDQDKGYGFIVHASGEEIFFHRTGIAPGEAPFFPDGTRVTYLVEQTSRGSQAVDVARMDAPE